LEASKSEAIAKYTFSSEELKMIRLPKRGSSPPASELSQEGSRNLGNKRKWDATLQKHAKSASELLCKAIASQREKLLSHN
jgi:hypothetical protein